PEQAELDAIQMLLALCRQYRFSLHIVHLSTARALELLEQARAEGLPVSVETCPHYLYFHAEMIPNGATLYKCAPPIRSRNNREKLWQGLRQGIINLVVTDHSPCSPAMKKLESGDFRSAWGGIPSLSVALSAVWTEASRRGFRLEDIALWMAEAPARLLGLSSHKGRIAAGNDADFVIFDSETEFVVTEERLYQRHRLSPYLGEKLRGVVRKTYLRGECVFSAGEFPGTPRGRELRR
ncbi:MAG: amidohydrolase family protein, partial [Acidobacteria bacterium]|nr:amidohydrolase family protein [Acidobacteriota bacterium]